MWHTCDDGGDGARRRLKKMPAHSTMCIWHIGLALTSHNLLRIKNSVYVHNSPSYHTNFLPSPSHSPSRSISHQFFSYFAFCWCERCEEYIFLAEGWGRECERRGKEEKEKWENAATRNIQNNVYFNVLRLPMSPCFLSLTHSLAASVWLRHDVYKGQLVIRFCSTVEMWVYGKDALCCLARKRIQRRRCPNALDSFTNTL